MGGLVLDDELAGKANNAANADFVFVQDNVVAELKTLATDKEAEFAARGSSLIEDWTRRGKLPPSRTGRVALSELSAAQRREVLKPLRNYLKKHIIGDANKQIKQTKLDRKMPTAKGLLLIANDTNYFLAPDMMGPLLGSILVSDDFSAINSIVYFTMDMKVEVPKFGEATLWAHWSRKSATGRQPVTVDFMERLRHNWMAHASASVFAGRQVVELQGGDGSSLTFKRPL